MKKQAKTSVFLLFSMLHFFPFPGLRAQSTGGGVNSPLENRPVAGENQEVKGRLRFGVKAGMPILFGLNCEYLTTALENRLSADMDFCYYTFKFDEVTLNYSNFGLGANYYFFKPGRGLYGGLGYYRLGFFARQTLVSNDPFDPVSAEGTGSLAFHNLNMKVGGKHGKSFYFRWELGVGVPFSGGDLYIRATIKEPGMPPETLEEKEDVPFGRFFIFNLGIGFAVL